MDDANDLSTIKLDDKLDVWDDLAFGEQKLTWNNVMRASDAYERS